MKKYCFFIIVYLLCVNSYAQIIGSGLNGILSERKNLKECSAYFPDDVFTEFKNNEEYLPVIIRVDKNNDLSFLENYDCYVGTKTGRVVTLKINVKDIDKFVKDKNIIEADVSKKVYAEKLNNAVGDCGVENVWSGLNINNSYTGKDVIIGIADWGIDYTHPTFYDSLGSADSYRVIAAWDQFKKDGPAPDGFDYGRLHYGREELLEVKCDTANQLDTSSHATHVAGIAAGSGAGTEYKGIAYESDILFCTWIPDELHYIECCTWMKDVAKALNKRLVINNSWGVYNFGVMDGTSMIDEFINTMTDEDSVIFVVSAGNNGNKDFHLKLDFDGLDSDTVRTEIEFNFPSPSKYDYWGQFINLQSREGVVFSSKIEFYDRSWNKIDETSWLKSDGSVIPESYFVTTSGDSLLYRGYTRVSSEENTGIEWTVRISDYTTGKYHAVLCVTASSEGSIHAWNVNYLTKAVGNTGYNFKNSRPGYVSGDNLYSISEPGVAEKAITVAAYQYDKAGSYNRTIASFSSRGPVLSQYSKPDISAPGYNIISSYSSFAPARTAKASLTFDGKNYDFVSMSGTSMSAPVVSGAVALMLQANPVLMAGEVKEILLNTATHDSYTSTCPNTVWGNGKLNVYNAIKVIESDLSDVAVLDKDSDIKIYPVVSNSTIAVECNNMSAYYVFDVMGRRMEVQEYGKNIVDVSNLKAGTYFIFIYADNIVARKKFIKY